MFTPFVTWFNADFYRLCSECFLAQEKKRKVCAWIKQILSFRSVPEGLRGSLHPKIFHAEIAIERFFRYFTKWSSTWRFQLSCLQGFFREICCWSHESEEARNATAFLRKKNLRQTWPPRGFPNRCDLEIINLEIQQSESTEILWNELQHDDPKGFDGFLRLVLPGRLTWNLQITYLERKMIFQTSMIMFHVNLPVCSLVAKTKDALWKSLLQPCFGCQMECLWFCPLAANTQIKHARTGSSYICLKPQTTIYKWMFGETTIFYIKIGIIQLISNHL